MSYVDKYWILVRVCFAVQFTVLPFTNPTMQLRSRLV